MERGLEMEGQRLEANYEFYWERVQMLDEKVFYEKKFQK